MMGEARKMMQVARNPAESDRLRALMGAFAKVEAEQRESLRDLADAAGVDPEEAGLPPATDHDDRVAELCDAVGARFGDGAWEAWTDHVAPDALDAEAAAEYAGLSADEWADEREAVVRRWREDDDLDTEGVADADLLDADLRHRFGVDAETFEEFVVDYSEPRLFESLLAGEFEMNTAAIDRLTEEVDE